VIDSADVARMDVVKKEIEMLLGEDELRGAALLVFANKQDIQGALSEGEIAERLELAKKCKERSDSFQLGVNSVGTGAFVLVLQ
jgi:signal recognition particle receptor subunit beta